MNDESTWALSVLEETIGIPPESRDEFMAGVAPTDLRSMAALLSATAEPGDDSTPSVNAFLNRTFEAMVEDRFRARRPAGHLWYFPQPHRFAAFLSHDVDEVRWSWRRRLWMGLRHPRSWTDGPRRYRNFDRVLAQEDRWQVRSSFFAASSGGHPRDPPYALVDVADDLKRLEACGWEVGVHGTYESFETPGRLTAERAALARLLGREPDGVRQHFLNLRPDRTWGLQEEAGFAYDSTLANRRRAGFRVGFCLPYRPPGHRILEIPITAMDSQLFWYEKVDPARATARVMGLSEAAEQAHGVMCLNWHQHTWDELSFPGWWEPFLSGVESLRARGAWFVTGRELAAWWNRRSRIQVVERESVPGSGMWDISDPRGGPAVLRIRTPDEHDWRVRVEGTDLFHADIRGQEALVSLSALPAGTPVRVTAFAP